MPLTSNPDTACGLPRLARDIRFDTLFAPFHLSGVESANLLTNAAPDATSRILEFKVCALRIERSPSLRLWEPAR